MLLLLLMMQSGSNTDAATAHHHVRKWWCHGNGSTQESSFGRPTFQKTRTRRPIHRHVSHWYWWCCWSSSSNRRHGVVTVMVGRITTTDCGSDGVPIPGRFVMLVVALPRCFCVSRSSIRRIGPQRQIGQTQRRICGASPRAHDTIFTLQLFDSELPYYSYTYY